jgi:hypothetical protein
MLELGTHQEIFDKVANHLLTQNQQALIVDFMAITCAYRGPENTMCAVGCLIPDNVYTSEFEGKEARQLEFLFFDRDLWLLENLQQIHDLYNPIEWQDKLNNLAIDSGLLIFPRNQKVNE